MVLRTYFHNGSIYGPSGYYMGTWSLWAQDRLKAPKAWQLEARVTHQGRGAAEALGIYPDPREHPKTRSLKGIL